MYIRQVSELGLVAELHEPTTRTGISAVHREGLGAVNWDMQVRGNNTSRKRTLQRSKQALGALTTPNDANKQVRFPDSLACSQEFTQGIPSRASLSQATSWKLVWAALQWFCCPPIPQAGSNRIISWVSLSGQRNTERSCPQLCGCMRHLPIPWYCFSNFYFLSEAHLAGFPARSHSPIPIYRTASQYRPTAASELCPWAPVSAILNMGICRNWGIPFLLYTLYSIQLQQ
ncbi:hypothetical protein SS50377_28512 [Spironucleus salmonicida]|uniref:Uncharacterized protein n=1 Tax=Spironucleus salmonicida TaxID=348837 RepID=V6LE60_9EUKA|nr:hypothetical protein SS50377_28512 [Spironucleus salmonicida]|eukprot:EST42757.1 Hypothetical protein SS50377_17618 [Spironucleus salmonicida]